MLEEKNIDQNNIKNKISLVLDIYDFDKYPKNYYTKKNTSWVWVFFFYCTFFHNFFCIFCLFCNRLSTFTPRCSKFSRQTKPRHSFVQISMGIGKSKNSADFIS